MAPFMRQLPLLLLLPWWAAGEQGTSCVSADEPGDDAAEALGMMLLQTHLDSQAVSTPTTAAVDHDKEEQAVSVQIMLAGGQDKEKQRSYRGRSTDAFAEKHLAILRSGEEAVSAPITATGGQDKEEQVVPATIKAADSHDIKKRAPVDPPPLPQSLVSLSAEALVQSAFTNDFLTYGLIFFGGMVFTAFLVLAYRLSWNWSAAAQAVRENPRRLYAQFEEDGKTCC
mmetsp:Transcript_90458/g.193989  ORF Transcript_90458/g.193989 Transcript_90458/m.193989 type:complete len:227 (-) Transcript_90458:96-776(-)